MNKGDPQEPDNKHYLLKCGRDPRYTLGGPILNSTGVDSSFYAGMLPNQAFWIPAFGTSGPLTCTTVVEGPSPERFQKGISEGSLPVRKSDCTNTASFVPESLQMPGHRRRQSMRDQKAPSGSAALQSSPSKRYVLGITSAYMISTAHHLKVPGLHTTPLPIATLPSQ